jgi:flavin-dependent dehydrogenase
VSWINEIRNFLEDYSAVYADDPNIDIFKDLGIVGDDFHEMIEKYAWKYKIDMSGYIWYFHSNEEGHSLGGQFFKPPYQRVDRIPVTPQMLADFIVTKKWMVDYPPHEIPKRRIDLTINKIIVIGFFLGL